MLHTESHTSGVYLGARKQRGRQLMLAVYIHAP